MDENVGKGTLAFNESGAFPVTHPPGFRCGAWCSFEVRGDIHRDDDRCTKFARDADWHGLGLVTIAVPRAIC